MSVPALQYPQMAAAARVTYNHDGIRPNRLRKLQRNRCYICGEAFAPHPKGTPDRRRLNRGGYPTLDHVWPKAKGGGLYRNKLLAHARCNSRKSDRAPFPCEWLYLDAILAMAERPTDRQGQVPGKPQ